ncbi:MAG: hypothetical protein MZV64_27200 [Ignavibacteriales bacterium]|nr:hypothetical protein [Ignavibacteriales bacterium]
MDNIKLYSLQKGDGYEELANLPDNIKIEDLGKTFNDFSDTAGAIENCDLIITNDSAIVHLAGAMGKKTFLLLPKVPEWRWFLPEENDLYYDKTPWYSSVKIFRQANAGDWSEVMDKVIIELF